MTKVNLSSQEKNVCATALWGGGIEKASKEYGVTEDVVFQILQKFSDIYQKECQKRQLSQSMKDAREQLREELLLSKGERTYA